MKIVHIDIISARWQSSGTKWSQIPGSGTILKSRTVQRFGRVGVYYTGVSPFLTKCVLAAYVCSLTSSTGF